MNDVQVDATNEKSEIKLWNNNNCALEKEVQMVHKKCWNKNYIKKY